MATHRPPVRRTPEAPVPALDDAIPAPPAPKANASEMKAPATSEREGPRLHTDDLMALASMDPAELAALMAGAMGSTKLSIGDKVTGQVSRVGSDTLFVDLGGKSEGQLERHEQPDAKVGDEVTAYVVATGEMGTQLSKTLAGAAAAELVEEAHASGAPVEGKVTSRNKGGYEVRIGTVRAFCPASHISRLPDTDPDAYVGQTLSFRVIETGEKIVVSRRSLQEEEVEAAAEKLWSTLAEGQQHRGVVRNVTTFGFFVDIGGVDGLVPKREIAWGGVDDPRTAVRVGQSVEVRVLAVDPIHKKLTFSCRDLADDPWQRIGTEFVEGGTYEGSVVRVEPYGVFVELDTALQGLLHVSKLASGAPQPGERVQVRILGIDHDRRRLDLGSPQGDESVSAAAAPAERVVGHVLEVLSNGVVVQLDEGRTGWLDAREVDLDPGTVLAQKFRRGKQVKVRITGERGGKISLSMRDDEASADRAWRSAAAAQTRGNKGFGTFADLLKGLDVGKK